MKAILLLHGAAFSSETWESVGTLDMLNELGVSTVTIDLPSYHNSAKVTIPKNKIEYLSFIREQFNFFQRHIPLLTFLECIKFKKCTCLTKWIVSRRSCFDF